MTERPDVLTLTLEAIDTAYGECVKQLVKNELDTTMTKPMVLNDIADLAIRYREIVASVRKLLT